MIVLETGEKMYFYTPIKHMHSFVFFLTKCHNEREEMKCNFTVQSVKADNQQ